MAKITVLKALTGYFNEGDGKRPLMEWKSEVTALSAEERLELARGVVAITGDELIV